MGEILQTPAGQKGALKWKKQGVRGSQFLPMYMILHVCIRLAKHAEQTYFCKLVAPNSHHLCGRW